MDKVTSTDVLHARRRLAAHVWNTPCVRSSWLSARVGCDVFFKLENLQHTGSFKLRGALNKLCRLVAQGDTRPVLAVSAGNHGRAVAYGAQLLGLRATVIVPRSAPQTKRDGIAQWGAHLELIGDSYDEAEHAALQRASAEDVTFVSPYDDADVIAGQGTIALELLQQVPDLDTILVPTGGGGLLAGVAVMAKAINPGVRVIGVQPEHAPAMYHTFRAGSIVVVQGRPTIADALAGNIAPGSMTVPLICRFVDDIELVSEENIRQAVIECLAREQMVVEGGGAAAVAALLGGLHLPASRKIAALITGRNLDVEQLYCLLHQTKERFYDQAGVAQTW